MLSPDRMHQIEKEAHQRAEKLSDESLRKEAASIFAEHHDAPAGDERTELGIMDRVYTAEMIRRGLTAK